MIAYYDVDGSPITSDEWIALLGRKSTDGYGIIGRDERGEVAVSTVWLGLNHNWGDGPPLIFETMIFGGNEDGYQERYSTRFAAELGHQIACQLAFGVAS